MAKLDITSFKSKDSKAAFRSYKSFIILLLAVFLPAVTSVHFLCRLFTFGHYPCGILLLLMMDWNKNPH